MWFSSWLRKQTSIQCPRARAQHRPAAQRFRPQLEALEDRWLPSQIGLTVSSLADSGPGTLRAAIQTADAGSHSDKFTIGFYEVGYGLPPSCLGGIPDFGPSSLTFDPGTCSAFDDFPRIV